MSDHVASPGLYVLIFAVLLVLTGVTVWVATVDLGPWNTPVALFIACTKAVLVLLYFMHLRWSNRLVWVGVAAAVFWLFHMSAGLFADYLSRGALGPGS